jgi:YgiT-type zinc finger domain-containing protein
MTSEGMGRPRALCPRCNEPLQERTTRSAIWQGDRLAVVEGIPALVCWPCAEQYYDDDVSEALRRLNESGFPEAEAVRTISVPVFTLEGRIRERGPTNFNESRPEPSVAPELIQAGCTPF